ncbi:polysaccharide deacetylase family protein, partial [Verrucomicrobiota bacterium]
MIRSFKLNLITIWLLVVSVSSLYGFDPEKPIIQTIPTDGVHKEVVLTFDDGPFFVDTASNVPHPKLLKKLRTLGAKATFFLVGDNVNDDPTLLYRILEEGHMIGNHSMTHTNLASATNKTFIESEIVTMQELLKDATGFYPLFYRAAGWGTNDTVYEVLVENNLIYCNRQIDDFGLSIDPQTRSDEIMAQVQDGDIIALQPTHENYAALDILVPALRSAGYMFASPRTDDAPKTKIIEQDFSGWGGSSDSNTYINNGITIDQPRRDTTGTGYSWRSKGTAYLSQAGELHLVPATGSYFYTLFDHDGSNQPSAMIDMSGANAALQLDMKHTMSGILLYALIYDGTSWFASSQSVDMSDLHDNRNWLCFSDVVDWQLVDQSEYITTNFITTNTLPALTVTSGGTPDLKRIQGMGLLYMSGSKPRVGLRSIMLHREFLLNTVDVSDWVDPNVNRHIFGICSSAGGVPFITEIQDALKSWVEVMRWPGGGNIERYNLKYGFNGTYTGGHDPSTRSWIESYHQNVSTNMDFIVGVSSILGMDFDDPANPGVNLDPAEITTNLAGWFNHPEYSNGLVRGVEYVSNLVTRMNINYTEEWGINLAGSKPAGLKYIEVGNEIDLYLNRYAASKGISISGIERIRDYYSPVFREYAEAVHAVDPSVLLLGPTTTKTGMALYMNHFMKHNGDVVDLLTTHRYWDEPGAFRHDISAMRESLFRHGVDTDLRRKDQIQIGYTEFNTDKNIMEDSWEKAIWLAEVMNYFIEGGLDLATVWHIKMGNERAFFRVNSSGSYAPLTPYYTMLFYRNHINFTQSPRVVRVNHLSRNLNICAVGQDDALTVFVVNPSTNTAEEITLDVIGSQYDISVEVSTMTAETNGEWTVGQETQSTASMQNASITYTFPEHSIVAMKFNPSSVVHSLVVSATNGTVNKSLDLAEYPDGWTVELTATPANGYVFLGWSGDASGTANPLNVTMGSDKNITAQFDIPSDSDGDGMPDSWEAAYGLNSSSNDAASDADGDGFSNMDEYYAGTAPDDTNSIFKIIKHSGHDANEFGSLVQA